ncbi:hypothetical protein ACFQ1Q_08800 [Winogradskyella litorisediminis]|uniref:Uncharacterized protein n=1 Tax=Winogradskyella litorisediminis TaxID=1156618 RepID=A0ABW3N9V5_9FLAO
MSVKSIQIVAFDNPYPPNFGGAIDVFYKIEALSKKGFDVYLHYFYTDRIDVGPLKQLCKELHGYKRNTSLINLFSSIPYRVKTRQSSALYSNLRRINKPILFEGLHSTSVLVKHKFDVPIYLRTHNIEHEYSLGLAQSETNFVKKLGHYFEAYKLKRYESILKKVHKIMTLSQRDDTYFSENFNAETSFIPVFHGNEIISSQTQIGSKKEKFALYHGDLTSPSNQLSVLFLLDVFKDLEHKFIVAGNRLSKAILQTMNSLDNCKYVELSSNKDLDDLLETAHVNVLYSNQQSGTKLKVFNALYKGKHVIVNDNIVDDKAILSLCLRANTKEAFKTVINESFQSEFQLTKNRIEILNLYTPSQSIEQFIKLIN